MPRRIAGDGTLFKRSDGLWVGGVELPPGPDGKRRVKRVTSKNRNTLLEKLRQLRTDVAAGTTPTGPSTFLGRWLDYWFESVLPHRNPRPSTTTSYEAAIRLYIKPHLGAKRLTKLQPADIRDLYTTLQQTVSTRAAQKADQVLRLTMKAAVREGLVGVNVMDKIDKPAHTPAEQHAFNLATCTHLINTAMDIQGPMWSARWAMGFTTGARESEILGLEWDKVDLDSATVEIEWQLLRMKKKHGCGAPLKGKFPCGMERVSFCPHAHWDFPPAMEWRECEGTLVWTRPKTKAGTRPIPLVPEMSEVLRRLRESDTGPNPHNLVFHRDDGYPFTQDQDQKMWRNLLKAAKVPHQRQHSIRRSTATLLLEAGVDAHIIQSIIGHSNITMTRAYQHVNLELARRSWGSLSAVMPELSQ